MIININYWQVTLSARLSWILMEIPSFVVSSAALLHLLHQEEYHKMLLLTPFTLHYLNRSIIFPLKINNSKGSIIDHWSVSQKFNFQPSLCQSYAQLQHSCSPETYRTIIAIHNVPLSNWKATQSASVFHGLTVSVCDDCKQVDRVEASCKLQVFRAESGAGWEVRSEKWETNKKGTNQDERLYHIP